MYLGYPPEHAKLGVLGKVSSIIKGCVVIASLPNVPPLDRGSALYLQNRRPLGEVYDTIGPVRSPFYVVIHENRQPPSRPPKVRSERTTASDTATSTPATSSAAAGKITEGVGKVSARPPPELPKLNVAVSVGDDVFCALDDPSLSIKILCSELSKLRGSDASGLKDEELSPDQDFSDDEKEYAHRRKLEGKRPIGGNRRGRICISIVNADFQVFLDKSPLFDRQMGEEASGVAVERH
ncbi:H/ACA ribonucleoprotein complex non-core subunit NAF1 [Taenia solium]|eukprot:TsM_000256800 transcript=TsM_000256800 gene=TsM_000256800